VLLMNATWLTPGGEFATGTIKMRAGIIERLGEMPPVPAQGEIVFDGSGFLILPGLIDAHVHLREPGQEYKEGITNGSLAAAAGGVTTLFDMPNNRPPCSSDELLRQKKELFRAKCLTNWGLHVEAATHVPRVSDTAIASAKVYMAKSSSNPALHDCSTLAWVFERYKRVTIHAEDETLFPLFGSNAAQTGWQRSLKNNDEPKEGHGASARPAYHHDARPREAVRSALAKIEKAYESLPGARRPRLVLCHIATAEELQWVCSMKERGHEIYAETCPHYWRFTQQDYLERGAALKVNPPLRTADDRRAIIEALANGGLDFVSTDHAPHTQAEKANPRNPPSGIAGIEWLMPLLLQLVDDGIIGWDRLAQLGWENAARCYDIIGRDGIRVGNAGDLVLVEKAPFRRTPSLPTITRAGTTLYEGELFGYRVFATIVNGSIVQQNGAIVNRGAGQEVYQ
jgi:dihydroorotase